MTTRTTPEERTYDPTRPPFMGGDTVTPSREGVRLYYNRFDAPKRGIPYRVIGVFYDAGERKWMLDLWGAGRRFAERFELFVPPIPTVDEVFK